MSHGGVPNPGMLTGEPRVAAALDRLADIAGLPLVEQVDVYEDIQLRLAATLSDPASQA